MARMASEKREEKYRYLYDSIRTRAIDARPIGVRGDRKRRSIPLRNVLGHHPLLGQGKVRMHGAEREAMDGRDRKFVR